MVDIHCHPLFGVDDGPDAFELSLAMVKMAAADGITHLVATPHCNYRFPFNPETNQAKIDELQQAAGPLPKLLMGCDFHLSYENIQQLLEKRVTFTINATHYLLIELDEHFVPQQFDQVLYDIQVAGFIPIVTHPERNPVFVRHPSLLSKWVNQGCLVQVTAQSYTGRFGRTALELAERWFEHNLIHFFATDAHDDKYRPPLLSPCYDKVVANWGRPTAERLLVKNPEAVVNGQPLPPQPQPIDMHAVKPKRSWLSIFGR